MEQRKRSGLGATMLLGAMAAMGGMPMLDRQDDKPKVKDEIDLEKISKAQAKRERRAKRNNSKETV